MKFLSINDLIFLLQRNSVDRYHFFSLIRIDFEFSNSRPFCFILYSFCLLCAITLVLCFVCHNLRCALFSLVLVLNSFIIQQSDSTTCLCCYCCCCFFYFDVLRPFHCCLHHQLQWEYLCTVEYILRLANKSSEIMHPVSSITSTYTVINITIYIYFNYSLDFAFVCSSSLSRTGDSETI